MARYEKHARATSKSGVKHPNKSHSAGQHPAGKRSSAGGQATKGMDMGGTGAAAARHRAKAVPGVGGSGE